MSLQMKQLKHTWIFQLLKVKPAQTELIKKFWSTHQKASDIDEVNISIIHIDYITAIGPIYSWRILQEQEKTEIIHDIW